MRRLTILLLLAMVAGTAVILGFGHIATRATPSAVDSLANNEQRISLTANDGVKIAASFFPAGDAQAPVVLLLHGNGANRSQFRSHVAWLNAEGFSAIALDFRRHGESDPQTKSFGLHEARDAEAALQWIRKTRPKAKIAVIGVSLGGAAALLGDTGPLDVDAMVLKAVYPDIDRAIANRVEMHAGALPAAILTPLLTYQSRLLYGVWPDRISPIGSARQFDRPVLVIGGGEDHYTPPAETIALASAFSGPYYHWIVPNLSHDQLSDLDDQHYRIEVLSFLRNALGVTKPTI